MLHGREREKQRVTALVNEAWASRGGALVVRGQPGVGKSTLLRDAVDGLDGTQILTTRGIESESPLAFAALQRLLRPMMRHADRLPEPQASALRAAFGEQTGGGDRFLVFLATLSLLAEAAEQAPVLCVIDDAHWLDDASAAALLFTARRIGPERVALLFAARDGDVRRFDSEDLPELVVGGLDPDAAEALLREQAGAPLPADVCASLLRQTGGNPLALVELPRALSADQLLGVEPATGPAAPHRRDAAGVPGPQPALEPGCPDAAPGRLSRRLDAAARHPRHAHRTRCERGHGDGGSREIGLGAGGRVPA